MYKYSALNIKQFDNNKSIIVCAIPFLELSAISVFTKRAVTTSNMFEDILQESKYEKNHYQRMVNEERTKKISQFILKEIAMFAKNRNSSIALFPTSMILSAELNLEDSLDEYEGSEEEKVYLQDGNLFVNEKKFCLIIDGQHRLAGMQELYYSANSLENIKIGRKNIQQVYPQLNNEIVVNYLQQFQFQCTFVLNYDLWEQGKIFANVNFNQKPVNKSIYYDIFGAYPDTEKNEIFLAHHLAIYLNKKSVLKGMIKMHGSGQGYFSQAFFVEAIMPLFKKGNIWQHIPFDYLSGGKKHEFLPKFFSAFFAAIKDYYSKFWPKEELAPTEYNFVLVKTTGLAPLIALIRFVYPLIEDNINELSEKEIKEKIIDIFKKRFTRDNLQKKIKEFSETLNKGEIQKVEIDEIIKQEEQKINSKISGDYYFGSNSIYKGATGKSAQANLYKELASDMGFIP